MNFFEHQDNARRNTTRLVVLFALAVVSMILGIYLVAVIGLTSTGTGVTRYWQPEIFLIVALGVLGTVGLGSLTKTLALRGGGKVVALSMGGRLINHQTQDGIEQRVLNVVEEMAIASGTPVPPVYLMDHESGINAFAAGFTLNDAVIGVTRGCVEQLSRDELQGVMAHEFSHIINGDMRLNLRLIGVLQGILLIHIMGRTLMRGMWYSGGHRRSRDNKGAGFMVLMAFALTAIGFIGFICGRLIKSAVSRQREFLADASAVQFTRNPNGISGALRKIGGFKKGSQIVSPKAEEASHLFFGEALSPQFSGLFATHPPLTERIKRLENLPDIAAVRGSTSAGETGSTPSLTPSSSSSFTESTIPESTIGFASSPPSPTPPLPHSPTPPLPNSKLKTQNSKLPAPASPTLATLHIKPDTVLPQIGTAQPAHLDYARSLLAQLPDPIKAALKTAMGAKALIYALLLDRNNTAVRDRQVKQLKHTESAASFQTVVSTAELIHTLDPRIHLPLVDLTIPALRDLTKPDYALFFKQIQALVQEDGRISLSEYTLQVVLMRRLEPYFSSTTRTKISHTSIDSVWDDCLTILSGLANVGHTSLDQAAEAFQAGVERLPRANNHRRPAQPISVDIPRIGSSLKQLTASAPQVKQAMVDACAYTALMDGEVTLKEAELLRAIVISLDCPMPPFLDQSFTDFAEIPQ